MPEQPPGEHLFDEKDIGAVLKRAAEIQGTEASTRTFGLSLAELQQVAAEAGIDPQAVEAAVAELAAGGEADHVNLWGGPLSLTLERSIEGEVTEATWEQMVTEIRQSFSDIGMVHTRGQVMEWTHSGASGMQAHVTATLREGHTRIRVFWHDPVMAAPVYVITSILGLILAPVLFESLALFTVPGVALYFGLLGALFLLARWTLSRMATKEKRKVRRLLAILQRVAAETTPQPVSTRVVANIQEGASPVPLLNLDDETPASEHQNLTPNRTLRAGPLGGPHP